MVLRETPATGPAPGLLAGTNVNVNVNVYGHEYKMFDTMDDHLAAVLTFGYKMAAGNKMADLHMCGFIYFCRNGMGSFIQDV